jgi:acylaminoacyl-peptidase
LKSPSGKKLVVLKKAAAAADNTSKKAPMILELWIDHGLVQRIELSPKTHGNIIHDPTGFGVPVWSPDENYLLYSAERAAVETSSFWDNDEDSKNNSKKQPQRGGRNVLHQGKMEEWGEKHVGQSPLLDLFLLHVHTMVDNDDPRKRPTPQRIPNVPGTFSTTSTEHGVTLGQAIFHPDDNGHSIVYTGWDAGELGSMPRRLGFIFCRNRPSKIYQSNIQSLLLTTTTVKEGETATATPEAVELLFICLTPDHALSRSPQFAMIDGKSQLIFLSNPKGFHSHDGCMGLYRYDESTKSIFEILEVVNEPYTIGPQVAGMGFPGLFLSSLPPSCGQLDNFVFLSTIWGSMVKMIRIDLRKKDAVSLVDIRVDNGKGQEVNDSSTVKSQSILCGTPEGGWIVSEVALNQPARILHVPGSDGDSSLLTQDGDVVVVRAKLVAELSPIACTSFSSVEKTQTPSPSNHLELISIQPPRVQGAVDTPLQSLLLLPKMIDKTKKIPLVVVPHGGPHSCSTSSYIPGPAFLCDSGYAVLFPNYRGSIGFGQASIESLLTRVGSLDVEDVMAATNHVLETMTDTLDASRVGICGGSHGGFLTGHCTGQYPEFFKAAVMRNPVTNIATMTTATDIADWCYTEVFGTYHSNTFRGPTADELQVMWSKSPVAHQSNVKTPTMIALGMVDLRVPPSQGLEWYHSLRSRAVPTKLLVYPEDCHALDKVTTEADHWIHIKQWFDEHL